MFGRTSGWVDRGDFFAHLRIGFYTYILYGFGNPAAVFPNDCEVSKMVDIFKVLAVLAAMIYLNKKAKHRVSTANYWTMNAGLSLLLFAAVLDFTDGIPALNKVPI
jgi:hypothetical protein